MRCTKEQKEELVKKDPWNLYKINNQPFELCLLAVNRDGLALQFVKRQTAILCRAAVEQNPRALQFVKKQDLRTVLIAVSRCGLVVEFVDLNSFSFHDQEKIFKTAIFENSSSRVLIERYCSKRLTEEMIYDEKRFPIRKCLGGKNMNRKNHIDSNYRNSVIFVSSGQRYVNRLQFIPDKERTAEICFAAVKLSGESLQYVKDQKEIICLEAVKNNGCAVKLVKNQTEEICLEAVKQNGHSISSVKNLSAEICLTAVRQNSRSVKILTDILKSTPTSRWKIAQKRSLAHTLKTTRGLANKIYMTAVEQDGWMLKHIYDQTEEICLGAVKNCWSSIQFVKKQTKKIADEAFFRSNGEAAAHITYKYPVQKRSVTGQVKR